MATFDETIHEITAAAQAAGLLSGSGQVDVGQVESALLHALRQLCQAIDIDGFKRAGDPLFQTLTDEHTYALPPDFGRLTRPDDEEDSGLFVYDVANHANASGLRIMELSEMLRRRDSAASRPTHFALTSGNQLRLFPAPDVGPDSQGYRVCGVYIMHISARSFDGDVPLPDHTYLRDMCMAQMAMQLGHPQAPALTAQAAMSYSRILNEHLRLSQAFQYKHSRYSRGSLGGRH